MIGTVDDENRALVEISVGRSPGDSPVDVTVWIDTAFDGHLVFPQSLIEDLQLESLAETEATLADGNTVTLETFICYLHWFGHVVPLQVISNAGRLPLLGTGLLEGRVLHIDYLQHSLTLT